MFHDYLRAKRSWEGTHPRDGYALLVALLAEHGVSDAFADPDHVLDARRPGDFETGVRNLLTSTLPSSERTLLRVPLARPWSVLFRADPDQTWVDLLLRYDFHKAAAQSGFDEEAHAPPTHQASDLDRIIQALTDAARTGWLSGDASDRRFGGRAVLTLDDVSRADDATWGDLGARLHQELTDAFADAPESPWTALLARQPVAVAERFTFDLVGRHGTAPRSVAGRWRATQVRAPEYARAAVEALQQVLDGPRDELDTLVTLVAGHPDQGKDWLAGWLQSLREGDGAPPR